MCTTCGCGHGETKIEGHAHDHDHEHGHDHHHHGHAYAPKHSHAPGMTQSRMLKIEQDILAKNDGYARENRAFLAGRRVFALNLVSSPGSGKTTLLVKTIGMLAEKMRVAVIEGDQQTSNDAERIRATGAPAIQINTGKGCHLDAHMVGHAMRRLLADEHFPAPWGEDAAEQRLRGGYCSSRTSATSSARLLSTSARRTRW